MGRDSTKTKEIILKTAEKLFSQDGFDATSVDSIAKTAQVNKALIYYYFKSKDNLLFALFVNILYEFNNHLEEISDEVLKADQKIKYEIKYLTDKKDILSIILMESLKKNNDAKFLFKIMEKICYYESKNKKEISNSFYIFEFFTGIMPLLSYVVYKKKWLIYFKCEEEELESNFIRFFIETHLNVHPIL